MEIYLHSYGVGEMDVSTLGQYKYMSKPLYQVNPSTKTPAVCYQVRIFYSSYCHYSIFSGHVLLQSFEESLRSSIIQIAIYTSRSFTLHWRESSLCTS
jgi:hypothetical protein